MNGSSTTSITKHSPCGEWDSTVWFRMISYGLRFSWKFLGWIELVYAVSCPWISDGEFYKYQFHQCIMWNSVVNEDARVPFPHQHHCTQTAAMKYKNIPTQFGQMISNPLSSITRISAPSESETAITYTTTPKQQPAQIGVNLCLSNRESLPITGLLGRGLKLLLNGSHHIK